MTGMLAGPDCAAAVLFAALAVLRARAAGTAPAEAQAEPHPAAWVLLVLLWVGLNAGALAAEALWQRTVEHTWNAACARRRAAVAVRASALHS